MEDFAFWGTLAGLAFYVLGWIMGFATCSIVVQMRINNQRRLARVTTRDLYPPRG